MILYTRICQGSGCLDQLAALRQQTPPTPARHQNPATWKVAIVLTSLIGSWFLGSIGNFLIAIKLRFVLKISLSHHRDTKKIEFL